MHILQMAYPFGLWRMSIWHNGANNVKNLTRFYGLFVFNSSFSYVVLIF